MPCTEFFFLEYAGELRIIALRGRHDVVHGMTLYKTSHVSSLESKMIREHYLTPLLFHQTSVYHAVDFHFNELHTCCFVYKEN